METDIVLRDPRSLKPHPIIASLPKWSADDERLIALAASIQDGGLVEPIKVTVDGLIADGRHRWMATKRLNLDEIECIIVRDEDVATIAMATLLERRHYTPGQRAYLASMLAEPAFKERQKRKLENLRNVVNSNPSALDAHPMRVEEKRVENLEEFCARMGVSVRTMQQAREIRELFAANPEPRTLTDQFGATEVEVSFRDFFEPRILDENNPYSLGGALTGIKSVLALEKKANAGKAHTGGKPKAQDRQMELFVEVFNSHLRNRYEYWAAADENQKAELLVNILPAVEEMPIDLLEGLEKKLRAELKKRTAENQ